MPDMLVRLRSSGRAAQRSKRVVAIALTLVVASLALAGCSGETLRAPSARGPYGAGITQMTFTRASTTTGRPRVLDTVIWYPIEGRAGGEAQRDARPASRGGPFPIVLFSHGSSGEPTQLSYLTEQLASWGFVVVAPPHPGNTKADGACDLQCLADSFQNRVDDVTFALDQVLALRGDLTQPLGAIIDPERTAVAGFSFGGMTAVRSAPAHRFDAIVGLAPAAPRTLIDVGKTLDVPILVASGGEDIAVPADQVQDFYDALPNNVPRYGLFFLKAKHTSFQDDCAEACELPQARAHELIDRYVTAFLEVYLVGDERYLRFLDQGEPPDVEVMKGGT